MNLSSCSEDARVKDLAQLEELATSLLIADPTLGSPNQNDPPPPPGDEVKPVLLTVTPSPESLKVFQTVDLGLLPEAVAGQGGCGPTSGYDFETIFEEGEYFRIRQVKSNTPGDITVDAVFDRPVADRFYRLGARFGGGGSGTFQPNARPDDNTVRFLIALNHRFPGVPRLSTDTAGSGVDNEIGFSLSEMANGGATFNDHVFDWKSSEKFEAPFDYTAKVSFECVGADCYAIVKYRLKSEGNYRLASEIHETSVSLRLTNPANPSQTIGTGRIDLPSCYLSAKTAPENVWFIETRIRLNDSQIFYTPQDLQNGNYLLRLTGNFQQNATPAFPNGINFNYGNTDIIRE
ncbi:hypothetical protein EHQ12_05175 [Leptospira gomenensis]|uniref:Uncharacterized protein n=3 Tax=Leptospira gomenensis TaxID=2484974 RepID=A0A5F1YEF3_9LEPT|nr:hypothetical protein [Leptospira gomenensis]TGK36378.1 hypothetical protein EHQ17_04315 [Leptospira gomenensis]TGK42034.1 hypothetical protein EHQ12_05175 [Leptospira gomenensis]TGK48884.1 hypothetical protein EHQ07_05445 [Leptospira gomenensis]